MPPMPLQIDTRLFSSSCAAMLADLLSAGLVTLKRPGGAGVLRLYTGGLNMDGRGTAP